MDLHPNEIIHGAFSDIRILYPASNQAVDALDGLIGAAPPGTPVSLCLDNQKQIYVTADNRGQWRVCPHFTAGRHHVRARTPGGGSAFITYTVREPL